MKIRECDVGGAVRLPTEGDLPRAKKSRPLKIF